MAVTSELIGLKQANRALKKLPAFARDEAQQVFNTTAFQFARMAATGAPRDTGALARAISWKPRPRSLSAVVLIDERTAFYWRFQEFGTKTQSGTPFLRPTAVRLAPQHQASLQRALEKTLSQMEREAPTPMVTGAGRGL